MQLYRDKKLSLHHKINIYQEMRVNLSTFCEIHTPIYVLEEERLRRNLSLIKSVAERADVEIILAFKAYALWKTFPIFREYIHSTTASSLSEAKLAFEKFGSPAHTFSPLPPPQNIWARAKVLAFGSRPPTTRSAHR